jgi:hypothetical protein
MGGVRFHSLAWSFSSLGRIDTSYLDKFESHIPNVNIIRMSCAIVFHVAPILGYFTEPLFIRFVFFFLR